MANYKGRMLGKMKKEKKNLLGKWRQVLKSKILRGKERLGNWREVGIKEEGKIREGEGRIHEGSKREGEGERKGVVKEK